MQVTERREDLTGGVACITFATPPLLAAFQRELRVEIPLFGDPERVTYEAFGFGRASVRRVWLDPRVWASYARLLARGRRMHRAREDTLQLGGDVALDADLRLRWIRRSRGPEDRPGVDELIAALAAAAHG